MVVCDGVRTSIDCRERYRVNSDCVRSVCPINQFLNLNSFNQQQIPLSMLGEYGV